MIRPFVSIKIQQVPTELWKDRNRLIDINFVNEYEIESSWDCHTDTARIVLPKNIILESGDFLFKQSGTYNVILGGSGAVKEGKNTDYLGSEISVPPLIMRGDVIYIQDGYVFKNENGTDVFVGDTVFNGFVSRVIGKIPMEIECEDNFFLLKRTPVNKSVWKGNLVDLCKYIVNQVNDNFSEPYPKISFFDKPDSITANFSLGHLDIGNMSCAQLLSKLRAQYRLESFFVGDTLHFGFPIYDEESANSSHVFEFENNIYPDSKLEYSNLDDVELSAIVTTQYITKTGKTTYDGKAKTKRKRKSILIYWDIATETFKYIEKKFGEPFPKNEGGERRDFKYPLSSGEAEPSNEDLFNFGKKELEKYHYTGYKGSFVTLGYPFVRWGDNVNIYSKIFADRNGQYKVRKVIRKGGVNGISQEVFIDYRLNIKAPVQFKEIKMI